MARRCYISFKTEDIEYKNYIQKRLNIDMIDRSLNSAINSDDEEYIMRRIREDYLSDSTVTIHLIGLHGSENRGYEEQKFIKRELQASLYHGIGNTQNGILGVVLPFAYNTIFKGQYTCANCGGIHNGIYINDSTTVREFTYNYYIPHGKCSHHEDDRFCVLVKWDDFILNPEQYIEEAFNKRSHPIAEKTRVRP